MNWKQVRIGVLSLILVLGSVWGLHAQVPPPQATTPVQLVPSYYALIPISATAAAATQTTLTLPAPPSGLYNYVCALTFNYSQTNTTGTVESNAVTTSTNFRAFALTFSAAAVINTIYEWSETWGTPASGCAKSTLPATATTFVSPAAATNGMFTWYATYFQAP